MDNECVRDCPIMQEQEALTKEIIACKESASALMSAIKPVLSEDMRESQEVGVPQRGSSDLCRYLTNSRDGVLQIRRALEEMLDRCEL